MILQWHLTGQFLTAWLCVDLYSGFSVLGCWLYAGGKTGKGHVLPVCCNRSDYSSDLFSDFYSGTDHQHQAGDRRRYHLPEGTSSGLCPGWRKCSFQSFPVYSLLCKLDVLERCGRVFGYSKMVSEIFHGVCGSGYYIHTGSETALYCGCGSGSGAGRVFLEILPERAAA